MLYTDLQGVATGLRQSLAELKARVSRVDLADVETRRKLMEVAKQLGEEYLHLEK